MVPASLATALLLVLGRHRGTVAASNLRVRQGIHLQADLKTPCLTCVGMNSFPVATETTQSTQCFPEEATCGNWLPLNRPSSLQESTETVNLIADMAATASSRKRSLDTSDAGSPGLRKRDWTVSIALPGSIVSNAQSRELQTHLVGVIARTACIFQIDEVVVFDDGCDAGGKRFNSCEFMARLLQYTETPQYLRKALFPRHPDLKLAGLLPPLDAPHHLRSDEWFTFREGVVLDRPSAGGSIVDVGLRQSASIPQALVPGVRVTVQFSNPHAPKGMHAAHTVGLSTAAQETAAAAHRSSSAPQQKSKGSA